MIYLIYCKNFCKCHNVPPPSTTIKHKYIENKNSIILPKRKTATQYVPPLPFPNLSFSKHPPHSRQPPYHGLPSFACICIYGFLYLERSPPLFLPGFIPTHPGDFNFVFTSLGRFCLSSLIR
jgi:hypothetical protein